MSRSLWPLLVGFTIWAAGFSALYGLQALGCALNWDPTAHRFGLVAGYLLTGAALILLTLQQRSSAKRDQSFLVIAGQWASFAAFVATALMFAPTLFLSLCI